MKSGVYQIVNTVSQKRYIGCSKNVKDRLRKHKELLKRNKHSNCYLQAAWNKYSQYVFIFEVIELCEEKDKWAREDYWTKVLQTTNDEYGYNIQPTDTIGRPSPSKESIEKSRQANKGRKWSAEHREKMIAITKARWANHVSNRKPRSTYKRKNYKKKVLIDKRKFPRTEETKQKIREKRAKQVNIRGTSVIQRTKKGEYIKEWESITAAAIGIGGDITTIWAACYKLTKSGSRKTAKGYLWEAKNNKIN